MTPDRPPHRPSKALEGARREATRATTTAARAPGVGEMFQPAPVTSHPGDPFTDSQPCPCRQGDVAAERGLQRPLLARAGAGDAVAFGTLYDRYVEGVYRFLVATTGDPAAARSLTEQVFRAAVLWLPVIAGGEGDLAAWLVTMARDAAGQHHARSTPVAGGDEVTAVTRLEEPQREVLALRLLLGHSLRHTAHLAGLNLRSAKELQLGGCLAVARLLGASPPGAERAAADPARAEELERHLERWSPDAGPGDPALAAALAVAGRVREAAPARVAAPDPGFVARLREDLGDEVRMLTDEAAAQERERALPLPGGPLRRLLRQRPWLAVGTSATALFVIVAVSIVLGLRGIGGTRTGGDCAVPPCTPQVTEGFPDDSRSGFLPALTSTTTSTPSTTTAPPTTAAPGPTSPPEDPTTTKRATTTTRKATTTTKKKETTTTREATTTSTTTTTTAPLGGGLG